MPTEANIRNIWTASGDAVAPEDEEGSKENDSEEPEH
jgi:hypothetical protein